MSTPLLREEQLDEASQPQDVAPYARADVPSRHASRMSHCRALITKNVILKKRQWSTSCIPWLPFGACGELILPIAVLVLLVWAKSKCSADQCDKVILAGWGGKMPESSLSTDCVQGLPRDVGGYSSCDAYTDKLVRPRPVYEVLSYLFWSGRKLVLAYTEDEDRIQLETMRDFISEYWHPEMYLSHIPCTDLSSWGHTAFTAKVATPLPCVARNEANGTLPSFKNLTQIEKKAALEEYLASEDYGSQGFFYGAVVFDSIGRVGAGGWSYSVRLNLTEQAAPVTYVPPIQPLEKELQTKYADQYMEQGFVTLQLLVNRYILGKRNDATNTSSLLFANGLYLDGESPEIREAMAESLRYLPNSVEAVPFPVAGIVEDLFYTIISFVFPLVFIVAFLYTQKTVINELITEKETKVRESLRMMGLNSFAIIGSWYVTYGVIFFVTCVIFSVMATRAVFQSSSVILVFLFFWLWSMAFLAFALFTHTLFNQARVGGIVGILLMFAQWILYVSQNSSTNPASAGKMILLMIFPNCAFCAGLTMLSDFESVQVGATWETLDYPLENSSFGAVLGMFCVDTVFWTLVGWYLDRVLPKEFGVRLPVYYLCLPSYWCTNQSGVGGRFDLAVGDMTDEDDSVCMLSRSAERVPAVVKANSEGSGTMVCIGKLRREFSTPGGTKVAVNNLQLNMYEGQILALLGHNGAGKSTTINMLTGMLAPSSGDATIAGHSILTGMAEIRQLIGVCPQHDVLWLELTVLEHLRTYARIRGVPSSMVEDRAQEMMQDVGLTEKANTRAGSLSGGQKRKLSLCLALISKPRVSFLDEPTSGMDPFSRRSTWNIVQGVREGRVTVLTTHFMDEADILGDRIAIMAEGELQCCGSSLFLKTRFGAGYRITCARHTQPAPAIQAAVASGEGSIDSESAVAIIRKHVPEAELLTNVGAEMSMRLPTVAAPHFPDLFIELDGKLQALGLEHYGLSMVTLEEVFLRIASGEVQIEEEIHPDETRVDIVAAVPSISSEVEVQATPEPVRMSEAAVIVRNFCALYMKRARYARRDMRALCCSVLLPVVLLVLGLLVINKAGSSQSPTVEMHMESQFGANPNLPYHAEPGTLIASGMPQLSGLHLEPEHAPEDLANGNVFGRTYLAGLPVEKMCEPTPVTTNASKCSRQLENCDPVWSTLQQLDTIFESGVTDCQNDGTQVAFSLREPCSHDMSECINTCKDAGSSAALCEANCKVYCGQSDLLANVMEELLGMHTLSWLCPVECAGKGADTCPIDTVCKVDMTDDPADPNATLSFERVLFQQSAGVQRAQVRYGAVSSVDQVDSGTTVTLEYNSSAAHVVPTLLNLASNALRKATHMGGTDIRVASEPLPFPQTSLVGKSLTGIVDIFSTFVIIMAFSFIPASIVAYVVRERELQHNSKHQQLISGVNLLSYWVANLAWDLCVYVLPAGLSILFIWAYNLEAFVENGALWAVFLTFVGYGLAIAPFSYLLSFLFEKHTTAQAISLVFNFLSGLLLVIVSYILNTIESTKATNKVLMWFFRLFPSFSLGHSMLQICSSSLLTSLGGATVDVNLIGWDVAGPDILYLFVTAPLYMIAVVVVDYILHSPLAALGRHLDPQVSNQEEEMDVDVAAEGLRVQSSDSTTDVVRILALRKVYRTPEGAPKFAVKDLSFGLPRGECFGFLGINGAGKTSTLNMLTGAILPSGGTASLGGFDIVQEQWKVRRLIGYCPQHDALLDRLTVREHLHLFGRIKGTPLEELNRYCETMMADLSLTPHMNKLSMTLSGGNKRKLSLAISMMGSPPLIFLDEPSTGVDPAARRLMWRVIEHVSTKSCHSSVMLTTHNMEEAEALCSRIGIMVGGRLRCIGSNQHLKARFGKGYQLEVRLKSPVPSAMDEFVQKWTLPEQISPDTVSQLCGRIGDAQRATWICAGCEEGHLVHSAFERGGRVSANVFAEWWLLEDVALGLANFLNENFPGNEVVERHDRTLRFRLPPTSSLADVFRSLEHSRENLGLAEYGISQTSLEQIFNDFAARQKEETGPVRGLGVANMGSAPPHSQSELAVMQQRNSQT